MSKWAESVPVVKAAITETPKPVTFVYPYYENAAFLRRQIDGWLAFPETVRRHLAAIIVDDGSPKRPAIVTGPLPFPIRVFRVEEDRRWNWLAARNIGMHHAESGWCLMTDMDHVVPVETAEALVFGQHDPAVAYAFSRLEHTGHVIQPHSASWFIKKSLFWQVGGYDETLSGVYGSDGVWRRRLMSSVSTRILTDRLIRYEYVGDSSTNGYERKTIEDALRLRQLLALMKPNHQPKTLSFPYHEVTQ